MNPFQQIVAALQQSIRKGGTPQGVVQMTRQPSQPIGQTPQLESHLAQFGGIPNFLTPQALAVLKNNNPAQQGQQFGLPNTQQQSNPFVSFLQQRGIRSNIQQNNANFLDLNQTQAPIRQQSVVNGGFNARNIVIPNNESMRTNLAMQGEQQQKGDLI